MILTPNVQKKLLPEPLNKENRKVLKLVCNTFFKKRGLRRSPVCIEDINKAFEALRDGIIKGDLDATVIANYIFQNITHEKIRKRRVTAVDFEEFLTVFFEGERVQKENRGKYLEEISRSEDFWRRVSRNRLEKLDVRLGTVLLSVKTLIPENLELNAGSFSAEALFSGFIDPVPNERTDLGSKSALREKFNKIAREGKWPNFLKQFETMVENIFLTDWIFAIKGGRYLDIYTLEGKEFRKLLIDFMSKGPDAATGLLNRFEAHALRTELGPILSKSHHVKINLIGKSTNILVKIDSLIAEIRLMVIGSITGSISPKEAIEQVKRAVQELLKNVT